MHLQTLQDPSVDQLKRIQRREAISKGPSQTGRGALVPRTSKGAQK